MRSSTKLAHPFIEFGIGLPPGGAFVPSGFNPSL